jgi:hypothetical protein
VLTANSTILNTESYKVGYEKGYGFLIAFPPQVYELLRRFSPKLAEHRSYSQPFTDQMRGASAKGPLQQPPAPQSKGAPPRKPGMTQ